MLRATLVNIQSEHGISLWSQCFYYLTPALFCPWVFLETQDAKNLPNRWWVNRSPKWNPDLLNVLAHPENWDSSCRGLVPLPTCTHVCSVTKHWWHLKMKLPLKNLIHMSVLAAWLLRRRLSPEHRAVFLWIQWHYFHAPKMCLGVMLCLVLRAYRCKYFKVFTGGRKVTALEACRQLLTTSQDVSHAKISFCQWLGRWMARWRPHVWEVPVKLHHSSSEARPRFHFPLLLSWCVVEEDLFQDVAKTHGMFGSALCLKQMASNCLPRIPHTWSF